MFGRWLQLCFVNTGYYLLAVSSIAERNENRTQVDMPVFVFEKKSNSDRVLSHLHLVKQLQISEITKNYLELTVLPLADVLPGLSW